MTDNPKLWISTAQTPYGNEYGLVAVVAATREEAIAKASAKLQLAFGGDKGVHVPSRRYAKELLDGLAAIREVEDEVFVDWSPAERRR